jgi:CubicO group peptidase (beta-lactamase class C family)
LIATPQALSPANTSEFFRRAEAFGYAGGFHFAQGGQPIISDGYGLANSERRTPIGPNTVFDLGSLSKQFTAAAILRLEELGRLRTDDPISRHFRNVPADKQAITVHHLLTHSAGFPHDVGRWRSRPSREAAVDQILAAPLRFGPGERHGYSNAGYVLLAAIVETTSGQLFEQFLREHLWLPLEMTHTGMAMGQLADAEVAEGQFFDGPIPANENLSIRPAPPSWLLLGHGYMLSTLNDMHTWGEALRTGRILSDSSRRKLFTPYIAEDETGRSYYGYGWAIFGNPDGTCRVAHDGSAGVHYAIMSFYPEQDATAIFFTTQQRFVWRYYPARGHALLRGGTFRAPAVSLRSQPKLEQLAGDYRLPSGSPASVKMDGDRLFVDVSNGQVLRLFSPWPMLPPDRTADLGDRQALISEVFDSIDRRDYAPLLSRLQTGVSPDEERQWWDERWPEWTRTLGRYLGTDFAGTIELEANQPRSLALVRFERGVRAFGIIHSPDGRIYLDWMPQHLMRQVFLVPQEDGSFLAWAPNTDRRIIVTFDGGNMVIDNGQEVARATSIAH